jgi:hypothetical protein
MEHSNQEYSLIEETNHPRSRIVHSIEKEYEARGKRSCYANYILIA